MGKWRSKKAVFYFSTDFCMFALVEIQVLYICFCCNVVFRFKINGVNELLSSFLIKTIKTESFFQS